MLGEDEKAFQEAIRQFAEGEIAPRRHSMDEKAEMDPELIRQFFEMGLMGIETPEEYGGAGGSFTMACLAVEELGRVDGSVSVLVDVQNTLVTNAMLKWANEEQKKKYLPKLAQEWVSA